MKHTPFYSQHLALGAKMVPFAGFEMPVYYSGITEEHLAVRSGVGVFDVSHMGEFILKGAGCLELVQRLSSNDASRLKAGKAQYSCLTNELGGIVDDLLVYCLEPEKAYMLVVNAANIEKDWSWIGEHNTGDVEMHNISDRSCLLAVQGPKALAVLQRLSREDLSTIPYYSFVKAPLAGVDNVLISATGYTGAGGMELYFEDKDDQAARIWAALMEAGAPERIRPVGLGARDTLRLEMGYCLYGNDIDDGTSPLEAGLGWITKFQKEFTGKQALLAQKAAGVPRRLVGLRMCERGIPRHGYEIRDASGRRIGEVTSGTQSPSLGLPIALGYVEAAFAENGTLVQVVIRDKTLEAEVCRTPFLQ